MISGVSGSDISLNRFIAASSGAAPSSAPGEDTRHADKTTAVGGIAGKAELTEEELQEVEELKRRDREVRQHEEAHLRAAGKHATGGPHYEYETGPDGKQYAVGGEVNVDTSPVEGDPEATIQKMQQIRRAALAPASPSAQDRRVAAEAQRLEQEARTELNEKRTEEAKEATFGSESAGVTGASNTRSPAQDTADPTRSIDDSIRQQTTSQFSAGRFIDAYV